MEVAKKFFNWLMAGLIKIREFCIWLYRSVKKKYFIAITAILMVVILVIVLCNIWDGGGEGIIYIAGDLNENGGYYPSLCKVKGAEISSIKLGGQRGGAKSIIASGNNLYIAGWSYATARWVTAHDDLYRANIANEPIGQFHQKYFVATLWKHDGENTATQLLSDLPSYANSAYALGKQVYVAGCETGESGRGFATLWKVDGEKITATRLSGTSETPDLFLSTSEANSVYVVGKKIYVAGDGYDAKGNKVAILWRINGRDATTICLSENRGSAAISVSVSGNSVYVFGNDFDSEKNEKVATLWQLNGTNITTQHLSGINISNISNDGNEPNSAFILGGNVYLAGSEGGAVALWKYDGKNTAALAFGGDIEGQARSVFLSGKNLYVAGYEMGADEQQTIPMLWQLNGENVAGQMLGIGRFKVNDVFVK